MPQYDIDFGGKLIDAADYVAGEGLDTQEAIRVVVYLSLLACEISMKAFLEKAGFAPTELRACSHDLSKLSKHMCSCEIEEQVCVQTRAWIRGSSHRAIEIRTADTASTIGSLLDRMDKEASRYPNELRYGETLRHFPPQVVLDMARRLRGWCLDHLATVRRR